MLLASCGGGDDGHSSPADHWLLVMETTALQAEVIFVYASEHDCIGAGSYRLATQPERFRGYSCLET
jgi:hypothetical protein